MVCAGAAAGAGATRRRVFFLHRATTLSLNVLCGAVDITAARSRQRPVGRAFTDNRPELVADAASDGAHYGAADTASVSYCRGHCAGLSR